jgi:hypothetical protein
VSASLNLTFGAHSYSLQAMSIAVARNQISGMTAASVLPSNEVSMEVGQEDVSDFEASTRYWWISRCGSTIIAVEFASSPSR